MQAARWPLFYSDLNVLIHIPLSASALSLAKNATIAFLWGTWAAFADEYFMVFIELQHQYIILFPSLTLCGLVTHKEHTPTSLHPVMSLLGRFYPHHCGYSQALVQRMIALLEAKQRVLMHGHQGWNVRHGLCHIYMIYVYIWVFYSFCLFCCLFIIVTTQFVALYKPCKPKPKFR